MNVYDILYKKRDGKELCKEEIDFFIEAFTKGDIPDYQASALLMAIYFNGLSKKETFILTDAMRFSGDNIDLSSINGIKVDKHSTGGVGDKTTLIVGPLAASCGVPIAKMSGRGLGFTGGTIDKLESIPGFQTTVKSQDFINIVNSAGIAVIGQTAHIAPADKKLYALRDVTATVENMGLISSSIMSKKLAAGSDAILLDVKCGSGAFMKDFNSALELAEYMVEIGYKAGKETAAFITNMDQPLGCAVGNALEVQEAIDVLKGKGPEDITTLSLNLSAYMVLLSKKANTFEEAYDRVHNHLVSLKGLEKLRRFIKGQGGDDRIIDDYRLLPTAKEKMNVCALESGFVERIHASHIGKAALAVGAGRRKKDDHIELSTGIVLHKKVGNPVKQGEMIAQIYGNDLEKIKEAKNIIEASYKISKNRPNVSKLIKALVTNKNVKKY